MKRTLNKFGSRIERLGRRKFLGGSGAALVVGVPMLEIFRPKHAGAQEPQVHRFLAIASGSGMPMDTWTPDKTGPGYDLKETLAPFAPIQSKLNIYSGLGIEEGKHSPGDHGAGVAVTLTCTTPKQTHADTNDQDYTEMGDAPELGESIDQVMAKQVGGNTRIPSLQLGLQDGQPLGDGPYSPVYLKHLAWRSATEPLTQTVEPVNVFDQIFAGFDPAATAAQIEERLGRKRSVLDYVASERDLLLPTLGSADQQRLDQYFTAAREIESRLEKAQELGGNTCELVPRPMTNLSYPDRFRTMGDLALLALQCDATRVITLQLSCYRNDNMYGFLGAGNNHHSTSHPGNDRDRADYRLISNWIAKQTAELLIRMDAVMDDGGSLLDNSLVLYNNDCGEANGHDHYHLPVFTAGTARGALNAGRHLLFDNNTHAAGLYVTLMNKMGIELNQFGEKGSTALDIG